MVGKPSGCRRQFAIEPVHERLRFGSERGSGRWSDLVFETLGFVRNCRDVGGRRVPCGQSTGERCQRGQARMIWARAFQFADASQCTMGVTRQQGVHDLVGEYNRPRVEKQIELGRRRTDDRSDQASPSNTSAGSSAIPRLARRTGAACKISPAQLCAWRNSST